MPTSIAAQRAAKAAFLHAAVATSVAALSDAARALRIGHRVRVGTLYSSRLVFRVMRPWSDLIEIMLKAKVGGVARHPRARFLVFGVNADGEVVPLSRAYSSFELALGEAIATLEGETVLSPVEGEQSFDAMWRGIGVNVFLRKDAMR